MKKNAEMKNILIIDDIPSQMLSLEYILSTRHNVKLVTTGKQGFELARKRSIDLILLDLMMPEISGFELLEMLKASEETKHIPVIIITSSASKDDELKGLSMGAVDFIYKPYVNDIVNLRVDQQMKIIDLINEIRNLSDTDALTGIGNRRYFNAMLHDEWARAKRLQSPISFMILDIDNFKNFNDTYGHLNGDIALQNIASTIKAEVSRATDKVARWGGEEFAVILPDTTLSGNYKVAEDIRAAVETSKITLDDNISYPVTISVGVHTAIPDRNEDYSINEFLSDADKALYYAKLNGKNRVCTFAEMGE